MKSITRSLSAQLVFVCFSLLLPWAHLSFKATAGIEVKCIPGNLFALQQMAAFPQTSRNEEYLDFRQSCLFLSPGVCQRPAEAFVRNPATDSTQLETETTLQSPPCIWRAWLLIRGWSALAPPLYSSRMMFPFQLISEFNTEAIKNPC